MKRRGFLYAVMTVLWLIGFVCGSAVTVSNGQVVGTRSDETNPSGAISGVSTGTLSVGVQPTADPTNGIGVGTITLARADWSGEVGQFVRTAGNYLQTLQLPDGTTFLGEVTRGVPDGHGVFTQQNGTMMEGEWRHGSAYRLSGTWVGPDGTKEVGNWNYDGTPCSGSITWKNGREYKGDWRPVDGQPCLPDGIGTMTWPDGRTYTGHFVDGKMDGSGKMTHPDGKIEEGTWMQDTFVKTDKP